jgi:hypothetical protein
MTGQEFERRIRRLGRSRGVAVSFESGSGHGSHGGSITETGSRRLEDRRNEIGSSLLTAMLHRDERHTGPPSHQQPLGDAGLTAGAAPANRGAGGRAR